MTANPYDIADDGCRCSAWSAGECACGNYVDPSWKRIWQQGFDAAAADREARREALYHARSVITQYLSTAEQWRYDRVCWAFAVMLGEVPEDSPEPPSPSDPGYAEKYGLSRATERRDVAEVVAALAESSFDEVRRWKREAGK